MKRLYLLRHAKSSWQDETIKDFDRPLNERGQAAVPVMAGYFRNHYECPDLIIASAAQRTKTTATKFAMAIGYDKQVQLESNIYQAHYLNLLEFIQHQPANINRLMVVGHNPGMMQLANYLSHRHVTDKLPTCGLVVLDFEVTYWHQITQAQGQLVAYDYPKKFEH